MMDFGLGKHGKILNLRPAKRRTVAGDEDHLCLALTHTLESCLVSKTGLSRLHDQLDTGVHVVDGLLYLQEKIHG